MYLLLLLILSASNAMALEVTMSASVSEDARLTVIGSTNLPDGTELLATITDTEGVYKAEGRSIVSGGTFKAGPFPQPLSSDCTLNVISQIAAYQQESVRSLIGDCGEMLAGSLVVRGSVGGLIVSYHEKIVLKKKAAARKVVPAASTKMAVQKKMPTFNRYSSYCALKASGRKDLPPIPAELTLR